MKTRSRQSGSHPRAVFLIEMLGYLAIFAAVMLLVGDMVNMCLKVTKQTAERDTMITRVNSVIDLLRRDAWSSSAIKADNNGVEFILGTATIQWKATGDGRLTRTVSPSNDPARVWLQMPTVQFTARGTLLEVGFESGPGGTKHESITLASQLSLGGGM